MGTKPIAVPQRAGALKDSLVFETLTRAVKGTNAAITAPSEVNTPVQVANTISLTNPVCHIKGTGTINVIAEPDFYQPAVLIADDGFSLGTTGNIMFAVIVAKEGSVSVVFDRSEKKWRPTTEDNTAYVKLQATTPGTPQTGHLAITGTALAGTHESNAQAGVVVDPYGVAAGNTGEIRLKELAANGTNYVGFKAPDAIPAPTNPPPPCVWVLPSADAAGVFTSNGSLVVSIVAGGVVPVGAILMWGAAAVPTGWLLCDGSSVTTAGYPALFAVIGYTFGGGGANFNVPDMRQRFPLGVAAAGTGSTLGGTGGTIDHTHTLSAHTHDVPAMTTSSESAVIAVQGAGAQNVPDNPHTHDTPITTTGGPSTDATDGDNPPFVALHFIIKT